MADSYWRKRQENLTTLTKSEEALNQSLKAYYAKESEKLSREIASYYGKYGENNVIEYRKLLLSLTDTEKQLLFEDYDAFADKYPEHADLLPVRESIYKLNRAEGLKTSILIQQLEMGAIEKNQLQAHFEKMATLFVENSANFLAIDKNVAQLVVGQAWFEETDFSSRIWKNRQALAKALQNDVVNGIIRGEDYKRISRNIQEKFERVSRRDIERLVFTEDTYLVNEAAMQTYVNDPDFQEYEYMIADGRACDVCASLDGQRFKIAERVPGVNFPPMHPWCRCTFVPVYEGNSSEKRAYFAKDGLTSEGEGSIIKKSGAVSGALDPNSDEADEHAERYYASVRKMKTDASRIAENTGYSEETIQEVKNFIFLEKHDLGEDELAYFYPNYEMAQSWQRLIDGKNIQPHDLTLLKHEIMERDLMQQGYSQDEAHTITQMKYNYKKESSEYYAEIDKHNKK